MNHLMNPRMLISLLLGFSAGIPLGLTGSTLSAWMRSEHISLATIGLAGLVGIPYSFKFVWSPLLDRYVPPFLGRRTGWMVIFQLLLVAGIIVMAFSNPSDYLRFTVISALFVSFFSASQDIVIDAYRTDLLPPEERGPGAALYILGYRAAMLVSGGVALMLAQRMPWKNVYIIMALTMIVGIVATFFAPRVPEEVKPPRSLKDAVVLPYMEFFGRTGAWEITLFIFLYKMDATMTTWLATPFFMDVGYSNDQIALTFKGFGLFATIAGTLLGGAVMVKMGLKAALWLFGIIQAVAGLSFWWLADLNAHNPLVLVDRAKSFLPHLAFAVAAENFFSAMGTVAYGAFIMSLCNKRFSATQYALLTSIMALTRYAVGAPTGYIVESLGWEGFYIIATVISVPSLLMLLRYDRWQKLEQT